MRIGQVSMGCNSLAVIAFLLLIPLSFWHWVLPFGLFQFWGLHGSFIDIMSAAWPMFAWGILLAVTWSLVILHLFFPTFETLLGLQQEALNKFGSLPIVGILQGTWVALAEAFIYRWLLFYSWVIVLNIVNFLLLGFMGHGLLLWIYTFVIAPPVNFLSFGKLHPLLFSSWGWSAGAAALISHGRSKQRWVSKKGIGNWLLTWPISLFLFLVMVEYGWIAALLMHVIYEALLVVLFFLIQKLPRARLPRASQFSQIQPLPELLIPWPGSAHFFTQSDDTSETPPSSS
ncbi:hypothetical protein ccbrp13_60340 [Ktedonobacteria bacterium brp13]|nr:hypothetical protein ccbrp13_60340 [Ktedonobacteria bacterium brp13]